MEANHVPGYVYRWVNGIPGHLHVISGGVDLHLSRQDDRIVPESTVDPDPDNGFQGYVTCREELPTREPIFGLYATSVASPYDEFHIRNVNGEYIGRINRGRDGFYRVSVKDVAVNPRNQKFKSIPEALESIAETISGAQEASE